ncbi:MAG TPA: hypothetical protein VIA18_09320, partial [Polyangia bacterium]|nr:hypothetical protein [Polyangia bacterium]
MALAKRRRRRARIVPVAAREPDDGATMRARENLRRAAPGHVACRPGGDGISRASRGARLSRRRSTATKADIVPRTRVDSRAARFGAYVSP